MGSVKLIRVSMWLISYECEDPRKLVITEELIQLLVLYSLKLMYTGRTSFILSTCAARA